MIKHGALIISARHHLKKESTGHYVDVHIHHLKVLKKENIFQFSGQSQHKYVLSADREIFRRIMLSVYHFRAFFCG